VVAVAVAVIAIVAGCALVPGAQGDLNAPLLVTGRVVDANGQPVGSAILDVVVHSDEVPSVELHPIGS
jgi:hypothetical protein